MDTFLPLFTPLPTPDEMALWDEAAKTSFGIPSLLLMENAGREAFALLAERYALSDKTRVLVVMGGGNNGGDGAVISRYLQDVGCQVLAWHTTPLAKMNDTSRQHALMAQKAGVNFLGVSGQDDMVLPLEWRTPDIIVDAIMGTGIHSDLRDREQSLVRVINSNRNRSFIFSIDIPTGLCGYLGRPRPEAVYADLTVTFGAGKPGLFFPEAKKYTGEVQVRPIGMPSVMDTMFPPSWRLLDPKPGVWFRPPSTQHKGKAGRAMIIGGSAIYAGAPFLASLAALRTGSGLVHLACPAGVAQGIRASLPEAIVHPIGTGPDWQTGAIEELNRLISEIRPGAIAIGPGLGQGSAIRDIVRSVLEYPERCPVVVDADALHFFHVPHTRRKEHSPRENQDIPLDLLDQKDIITPHPGEMADMFRLQTANGSEPTSLESRRAAVEMIQNDRVGALRNFTRVCRANIVLKGPGTLIGQAEAPVTLAPFAVAALGVGGAGDVLTGICAALVASGMYTPEAACLAVYLHGRAGELLAEESPRGHLAREIADHIPAVWNELCVQS